MRVLTAVILVLVVYAGYISYGIYTFNYAPPQERADAAIVLGAALYDGRPSPAFAARIKHGIWLYEQGYVDKLIFTGGKKKNYTRSEALAAFEYALALAVPVEAMLLEEESLYTWENIRNAAALAREFDLQSFIIVSDPLHMKRAMSMAGDYDLQASPWAAPSSYYNTLRGRIKFMAREIFAYSGYCLRKAVTRSA